jgi:hypothetical protein
METFERPPHADENIRLKIIRPFLPSASKAAEILAYPPCPLSVRPPCVRRPSASLLYREADRRTRRTRTGGGGERSGRKVRR